MAIKNPKRGTWRRGATTIAVTLASALLMLGCTDATSSTEADAPDSAATDAFGADATTDADDRWVVSGTVRFADHLFPPPWGAGEIVMRLQQPGVLGAPPIAEVTVPVADATVAGWSATYALSAGSRPAGELLVTATFTLPAVLEAQPLVVASIPLAPDADGTGANVALDVELTDMLNGDIPFFCGDDPLDRQERACVFEFLWRFAWLNSPFLAPKGIDWSGAAESLRDAALDAPEDVSFYRKAAELVAQLQDHHWAYVGFPLAAEFVGCPKLPVALFEGEAYVRQAPDLPAGVQAGDRVVGLDGAPIADRLDEARTLYSDHHTLRFEALASELLLCGEVFSDAAVEVATASGAVTVTVGRDRLIDVQALLTGDSSAGDVLVAHQPLASTIGEVGYLRISTFDDAELRVAFDAAMEPYAGAAAIVVDVRGNGGGLINDMYYIVGRFLDTDITPYDRVAYDGSRTPVTVKPSGPWQFTGRVVVLTDELSFSASSMFSSAMRVRGATLVGRATGGGTSPVRYQRFQLTTDSLLFTSSRRYYDLEGDGPEVDRFGVQPDVWVARTLADLLDGTAYDHAGAGDPILAQALGFLEAQ